MKKSLISLLILLLVIGCGNSASSNDLKNKFKQLTTTEFNKIKGEEKVVIVDSRYNDYYNGWQDSKTKTSGHFNNATDFSAKWLEVLEKASDDKTYFSEKLAYDIKDKDIDKASKVLIYSSDIKEAQKVGDYFVSQKLDAKKINIYKMNSSHKEKEFTTVKDYKKLVSPKFVNDLVTTNKAENYSNNKYQLFEVSWGDTSGSYDKGHIEKSVHINTDKFEHAPLWSLDSDKDLIEFSKLYGIDKDATIIFYGEDQMASYRAAIILQYMGAKDVRVLNGGTKAYTNAGYELSKEGKQANKSEYKSFDFSGKKLIDTYDDINKKMSENWQLIDARTKEENKGSVSGYDDLKYKGTIPGSIFHGSVFAKTSGDVNDYINIDGTMKNMSQVTKMLKKAGIDVNKHMSFYCGSGWRVAQILFYTQINGYQDTSMYSNGWYEYSDKIKK